MKSFNNCMAIILLCAAGFVCAKQTASRTQATPTKKAAPIKESQPKEQPAPQVKTYKDLLGEIKNKMKPTTVWDSAHKKLKDQFITAIIKSAKDANLTFIECESLLQAARNFHAPFTNDNAQNAQILTNVNNQIATIKKDFVEPAMPAAPMVPTTVTLAQPEPTLLYPTQATTIKPIAPKKALPAQPEPAAAKAVATEPRFTLRSLGEVGPTLTPEEIQLPFVRGIVELQENRKISPTEEQPEPHYTEPIVQGIFALETFRKSSPKTFGATLYVNGELNKKWLAEALKTVLNDMSLTDKNRIIIQEELSKNATQMIKELLQNDKKITPEQLKKILNNVHNQVVRFINEQLTSFNQPSPRLRQAESTIASAQKPTIQRVKLKSQELGQAKLSTLPSWITKKNDQSYSFNCHSFGSTVIDYITKNAQNPEIMKNNNININTEAIVNNFAKQIPSTIPNNIRVLIIRQMEDCIAELM